MDNSYPKRVVFVQKFVPHYRLPFFERIRDELSRRGVEFLLIYGKPDPYEGSKVKMVYPDWGKQVNSKIIRVAGRFLYWQGALFSLRRGDMVVVEHAAKLLDNYFLYAASRLRLVGYGYFGHGENFQTRHELGVSMWVKKRMLLKVTRWFAYTEISRQSLISQGMDDAGITVVNNTLLPPENTFSELSKIVNRFVYIGGLYTDKRLDLILGGASLVAKQIENFELHIIGAGPLSPLVEEKAAKHSWCHYHGSLYGDERNRLLAISDGLLMPGLVGLVAVDSFFFRCPILTSHAGQHSPEVAYLSDGQNALFDDESGDEKSYAELILRYIREPGLKGRLQKGCAASADRYSLDQMVQNFCDGIGKCQT